MNLFLGYDVATKKPFYIPKSSFATHWHLIGGTGKGKTTAIHRMLHELLLDPTADDCYFILDRMGNLSSELLLWAVSEFCTDEIRDRIVYIEPAREDIVIGFNPLLFRSLGEGYFKTSRSIETLLRGWGNQNLQEMPRLARWLFNAMWACAQLGLTISDSVHLLNPGSPFHAALIQQIPPMLKAEWQEILRSHGSEASRILESTRNRLKPYFESDILRRMFGSHRNNLDVARMMGEKRIVIVNLASKNRLSPQEADAIGGLVINEVLATARGLEPAARTPTFLLLDEFQRFVGRDLEEALPEVRQLQIQLILSHQSFSQLERGDVDLTSIIYQAQSRKIFGVQGADADELANELASITFDPKRIKDETYTRRQLQKGHKIMELCSWGESQALAENWQKSFGENWATQEKKKQGPLGFGHSGFDLAGQTRGDTKQNGEGGGITNTKTKSVHQQLVPEYEEFLELSNRTYYTFDEFARMWGNDIRKRRTGQAFVRLVDDHNLHDVQVERSSPGHLELDGRTLREDFPEILDAVDRFLEKNFQSDYFVAPHIIDQEANQRILAIVKPAIIVPTPPALAAPASVPATGPMKAPQAVEEDLLDT